MKPHVHANEIHAWANGATVQFKDFEGDWRTIDGIPYWEEQSEYRASIAEVEGNPVFEGDVLYTVSGISFVAMSGNNFSHGCSWNPPKPKTITVTIPRPDNEVRISTYYYPALAYTNPDDQAAAIEAIKEAMK